MAPGSESFSRTPSCPPVPFSVVQRALPWEPPAPSEGCRKLTQYRGPFSAKSRELALTDRSELLKSFGFFHLILSAPPMALINVQPRLLLDGSGSLSPSPTAQACLVPVTLTFGKQPDWPRIVDREQRSVEAMNTDAAGRRIRCVFACI